MTVFQNVRKGLIPARLTVNDVYALQEQGVIDENERFELIEGEVIPMAAAKFNHHEAMKSALTRALVTGTRAEDGVFVEASVTLGEWTLVEPDLAVWPRGIGTQDVRGPDLLLVVEVAVSSLPYDVGQKAKLYARHGVRDYWVVDAIRRTVRIHRGPAADGYADVEEHDADVAVQALLLSRVCFSLDDLA